MKNTNRLPAAAVLAASLVLTVPASLPVEAQNRALQQKLRNAERIDCTFPSLVTGDWEDSGASAAVTPAEFEAAFFDIDVEEGTAEAEGRFGASFIVVRQTATYLHFMQMFSAGPLYLTTVIADETASGTLKAVHTRHEFSPTRLPGFTSRPEMYVGECTVQAREG